MTDEDAVVEDWISSQNAVDDVIVSNYYHHHYHGRLNIEESVDKPPWEESFREINIKTIFTFIVFTSILTLIIDPKMIVLTLPLSTLTVLLISMLKKSGGKKRKAGVIKPGEDEW